MGAIRETQGPERQQGAHRVADWVSSEARLARVPNAPVQSMNPRCKRRLQPVASTSHTQHACEPQHTTCAAFPPRCPCVPISGRVRRLPTPLHQCQQAFTQKTLLLPHARRGQAAVLTSHFLTTAANLCFGAILSATQGRVLWTASCKAADRPSPIPPSSGMNHARVQQS